MRAIALPIVILMLTATFAGCVGGDPDGDDSSGIDMDALNQMIDNHLQDFINNTTVTVNQDFHYYNNTTNVNNYDSTNNQFENTTNVDGGEVNNFYEDYDYSNTSYNIGGASFGEGVNGTVSGSSMMFVAHVTFTAMDLFPDYTEPDDPQENNFSYTYTYYDYLTNSERTDTFTFSCNVFYLVGSQSNNSTSQVNYWEDSSNYDDAWEQIYNSTIANMLYSYAGQDTTVRATCEDTFAMPIASGSDGYSHTFFTIDIPVGYALEYIQNAGMHQFYGCYNVLNYVYWSCNNPEDFRDYSDGSFWLHNQGPMPHTRNELYGGWDNLTIEFELDLRPVQTECRDLNGNYIYDSQGQRTYCDYDYGSRSVWPTSEYEFTLYYRFVPVIPVE
jgi:hypothetical protein